MHILFFAAGTNDPSNSETLGDAFIEGVQQVPDVEVTKNRIRDLHIHHFTIEDYKTPHCDLEEDFCAIQHLIEGADGILISTPVWNFDIPAHLKNFFDRIGGFALDETRTKGTLGGKPFCLIFTGGAPTIAWRTLMKGTTSSVPESIRYFGGSVIGSHYEPHCTIGKGDFGLVVDKRPKSLALMRKKGKKFAEVVKKFKETGKLPAKNRLIRVIFDWGQKVLQKVG